MTSRELLYIKTIAEEKSISKAARKLYIAQPSLSQSVQRLEEQLGTSLFNRTTSGLSLTYAGERYCYMAAQILKIYEDFELEISDINNLKTGRIHLGITNHLGILTLPKTMKRFHELCPFVEVLVTEDTSDNLEKCLLAGKVDFVIMHAPTEIETGKIDYEILKRDPFVIVTSPDHPIAASAHFTDGYLFPVLDICLLENQPMIRLNSGQRIRQVTDSVLKKAGFRQIATVMTVKNHTTAQLLAAQGIGITMVPLEYSRLTVEHEISPALFCIHEQYEAFWDMCIATSQNIFLSKADQLFIRCVKEEFSRLQFMGSQRTVTLSSSQ